jgi:N-acetylglucosamine-6-sulfatase
LIGKYLNGYKGPGVYVPSGWDRWSAFSRENGAYYNYEMFDDTAGPGLVSYGSLPRDYSTDVIRRKAVGFIRSSPTDTPFFLMVTPYAPHGPMTAAPRHVGDLDGAPVWLAPSVNERDVADKPAYIRARPTLADPDKARRRTRKQWEMLLAVDALVSKIFSALTDTGRDDNTLVIFTSDNGISNYEHRWHEKLVPHEESIRVPMIVRFPGTIPGGIVSDALVSNVDIAPTIADFAGASLPADGVSLRQLLTDEAFSARDSVVLEHYGTSVPSYCGVRTRSFMFTHYATGEEELYDLTQDPYQLVNVAAARPSKATELRTLTRSLCQPVPPGFSWG